MVDAFEGAWQLDKRLDLDGKAYLLTSRTAEIGGDHRPFFSVSGPVDNDWSRVGTQRFEFHLGNAKYLFEARLLSIG